MDQQKLGETLKLLRKNKNISQEELASVIKVSRQSLSSWERGETAPDIFNLHSLAKFYGLSMDDILNSNIVFDRIDIKDIYNEEKDNLIKNNLKTLKFIKIAIYLLGIVSALSYLLLFVDLFKGNIIHIQKATFYMTMPITMPVLIVGANLIKRKRLKLNIGALLLFLINLILIIIVNSSIELNAIFLVLFIPIYILLMSAVLMFNFKVTKKEITYEKI